MVEFKVSVELKNNALFIKKGFSQVSRSRFQKMVLKKVRLERKFKFFKNIKLVLMIFSCAESYILLTAGGNKMVKKFEAKNDLFRSYREALKENKIKLKIHRWESLFNRRK